MTRTNTSVARSGVVRAAFALVSAFMIIAPVYVGAASAAPDPQYGYCTAWTADGKKVYVSALFEIPMEDARAESRVIKAEFDSALVQKYGSPASPNEARSGGCATIWNASAAGAEEDRQTIFTNGRKYNIQVIDTGWRFVRTAQTPPPGPPARPH